MTKQTQIFFKTRRLLSSSGGWLSSKPKRIAA